MQYTAVLPPWHNTHNTGETVPPKRLRSDVTNVLPPIDGVLSADGKEISPPPVKEKGMCACILHGGGCPLHLTVIFFPSSGCSTCIVVMMGETPLNGRIYDYSEHSHREGVSFAPIFMFVTSVFLCRF